MHFCPRLESASSEGFSLGIFTTVGYRNSHSPKQLFKRVVWHGHVEVCQLGSGPPLFPPEKRTERWEACFSLSTGSVSSLRGREKQERPETATLLFFAFFFSFKVVGATLHELGPTFCRFQLNPDKNLLQSSSGIFLLYFGVQTENNAHAFSVRVVPL